MQCAKSHIGSITGLWILPDWPLGLNTNDWMNYVPLFCVLSSFLCLMKGGVVVLCLIVPQKKLFITLYLFILVQRYKGITVQLYKGTIVERYSGRMVQRNNASCFLRNSPITDLFVEAPISSGCWSLLATDRTNRQTWLSSWCAPLDKVIYEFMFSQPSPHRPIWLLEMGQVITFLGLSLLLIIENFLFHFHYEALHFIFI